jgi:predicted DNA-binding antitoxin AbrB/MazE fold protein
MSKVIMAVYINGVFRPLEPVVLPEGEPVQVHVPERPSTS